MSKVGGEQTSSVEFAVTGMHCVSCAELIRETLSAQPGVTRAAVDLDSATASVEFDASEVSVADLSAVVIAAGYGAALREDPASS